MLNLIATTAMTLAAMASAPGFKEAIKPPLAGDGTVIVRVLPHKVERVDGNFTVEGETQNPTARYEEMKRELDKRFAHMFELKEALDKQQSEMSAKWDEYYVLHEKYNRELKKIVASWVTESQYAGENDDNFPTPEARTYNRRFARRGDYEIDPHMPIIEK